MLVNGIGFLSMLGSLGSVPQKEVWDETNQVYVYTQGDQSVLILLYGVATILLTLLMIWVWRGTLKSASEKDGTSAWRALSQENPGCPWL